MTGEVGNASAIVDPCRFHAFVVIDVSSYERARALEWCARNSQRSVVALLRDEGSPQGVFEHGVPPRLTFAGKTLLDLSADDYSDARTLAESKLLMRQLMTYYLGGQALQSRRVFVELQDL